MKPRRRSSLEGFGLPERMEAMMSLSAINDLFGAILPANEFYAAKLGERRRVESLEEFREEIPFTTKDELAADHEDHPPYGTTLTYPLETYTRFHHTSGTRGNPMAWLDDPAGGGPISAPTGEFVRFTAGAGKKSEDFLFCFLPPLSPVVLV